MSKEGANDQWEWVKPCPAHAVCSWMQNLYDREPFCPLDPKYQTRTSINSLFYTDDCFCDFKRHRELEERTNVHISVYSL